MQGVIQKYVDSSISSTVNLAEDVSVETVANIYLTAYNPASRHHRLSRGSREGILQTEEYAEKKEAEQQPKPAADTVPAKGPRRRSQRTYGITERIRTGEGNLIRDNQ